MRVLDKLERKIIKKLQRYKIDGVGKISATNHKQRSPKGKILASAEQEKWGRYFELGMYWHGREEGNHKELIYLRRCLQLNPENEPANCYVGMILQKQGRYHESLAAYRKAISLRPELKELDSKNARLKKMYAEERLRADKTINDCWSMDFIMHDSLENGRRYRYIMLCSTPLAILYVGWILTNCSLRTLLGTLVDGLKCTIKNFRL
ncbi:tetratricopeptide repeat protein [Rickettsia amblyommatis]|uniref:TPR repeat-containing protein n=2 Tax=Rickettsia amblyommatis TaxID=33989 RepID=H8K686_RICAG|nr:tetratricopeptide repeat protein [Rickettsia amblyommatis]ADD14608.1 TPR repeat-containing protein [Rickettsia amblyommatis str. AaR/SC]AFC70397.1 TPR repeat-containing protein [Rickettsia amblyommatis str. GAT-30V]KJV98530.1 tetratricopeptide repeat family protein [Rickettsia amblyommatis str. Darkwater]